jgi:predicted PurR-regulated permease PerM
VEQSPVSSLPDDQPSSGKPPPIELHFSPLNVAVATAVVLLVVQAFTFLDLIRQVLLLLVLAILLATAIQPIVTRLRRSGVGRAPSVLGIYLVIVALTVTFVFLVSQAVGAQSSSLVADLPNLSERLSATVADLPAGPIHDLAASATSSLSPAQIGPLLSSILTTGTLSSLAFATLTVVETAFTVITVLVLAYFWLAERMAIRRLLIRVVRSEHRLKAFTIWEDVEDKLGAWMRGQLVLMIIIGVAQGVGYAACPSRCSWLCSRRLPSRYPWSGPTLARSRPSWSR